MRLTAALLIIGLVLIPNLVAEKQFQYFKLVQRWPRSFCNVNSCLRNPLPQNFTLHGLWPDKYRFGRPVEFCTQTEYKGSLIEFLLPKLDNVWTDLREQDTATANRNQIFWRNQWKKHGTCSTSRYDQGAYFDLAVKLKEKNYILSMLQEVGITPSSDTQYSTGDLMYAIKRFTRKLPEINCSPPSDRTKNYELLEFKVCFTATGVHYVDCPNGDKFRLCGNNNQTLVNFPPP